MDRDRKTMKIEEEVSMNKLDALLAPSLAPLALAGLAMLGCLACLRLDRYSKSTCPSSTWKQIHWLPVHAPVRPVRSRCKMQLVFVYRAESRRQAKRAQLPPVDGILVRLSLHLISVQFSLKRCG